MAARPLRAAGLAILVAAIAAFAYWFAVLRAAPASATAAPRVPVLVTTPITKDMPIWLASVGTVQSLNVVNIRARIDGELQAINFVEGQEVHAGDVLAQIDPRPFEAQLRQAEANLHRDEAQLAHAHAEVVRYEGLLEKGFVAQATVDTLKSTEDSLTASVQGDRAAIETFDVLSILILGDQSAADVRARDCFGHGDECTAPVGAGANL